MNKLLLVHNDEEPLSVRTQPSKYIEKGRIFSMKDMGDDLLGDMNMTAKIIDFTGLVEIIETQKKEIDRVKKVYDELVVLVEKQAVINNAAAKEHSKLKENAREVASTAWRVVENIPETKESKEWPFAGFVKSVKHHLKQIDYIFSSDTEDEEEGK